MIHGILTTTVVGGKLRVAWQSPSEQAFHQRPVYGDGNPVGLVHIAAVARGGRELHLERQFGQKSKEEILQCTLRDGLTLLAKLVAA